ncbi:hypothetical protein [Pseudomonas sp. AFG_SD02_1510_Pfu_092]|uniref:hypothetical protein n=1 Tax=Pseudomonas sp. AFG_SD02_1510_Pfu_092 TaxID=2259497 RepID=UPI001F4E4674|nr:hypothetical protein [Pseudomonas sp. AFG_SD02_1510_Pfu_092]
MSKPVSTTVKCQDPGDGSGDVIIDLPQDVLKALNVELGDLLSVELVNGPIELSRFELLLARLTRTDDAVIVDWISVPRPNR